MRKILKIIIISLFTIFSFYYTEKTIDLSKVNDPIMKQIQNNKSNNEIAPVNGVIEKDTMMVGTSGRIIDIGTSYEKMKKVKQYSDNLLEYISIKPNIKKDNYYDKLITGAITNERKISLVFNINDMSLIKQIVYILNKNNVGATFFIDGKFIEDNALDLKELFNYNISIGIYDYDGVFNVVGTKHIKNLLSRNFNYNNYCLYNDDKFLSICKAFNMNTIKPKLIEKNVYNYLKNDKENGLIYQIKANKNNIKELNSTLIYLKQKGYKMVKIDELLKE